MNTDQEDRRLELFSTLVDFAEEFGNLGVIVAIHQLLEIQVEEDNCCVTCQRKAEWLHREVSRVLARYEQEFPQQGAMARINHGGVGQVQ